jgi:hypothetical protein
MATRLIAVVIVVLSLLPIANWLPGGEADTEYVARLLDWGYGLALCLGVGGLVAYVARVRARSDAATVVIAGPSLAGGGAGRGFTWIIAALAFALYATIAQYVFSGRPLLIDEIVQVLQARWYVNGDVWVPTPALKEFYSILHVVDLGDRTYGQFPAGGPAMLAIGAVVNAEWLVGPVAGAISVILFSKLLATLEPDAPRGCGQLERGRVHRTDGRRDAESEPAEQAPPLGRIRVRGRAGQRDRRDQHQEPQEHGQG